jgi:hypothetical protein
MSDLSFVCSRGLQKPLGLSRIHRSLECFPTLNLQKYYLISTPGLFFYIHNLGDAQFFYIHCASQTYRYDVNVYQLWRYCHFPITIERYLDLRIEIRCEILLFPRDLYFLGFSFSHRSVVEPYAFGSCGRRLWKKCVIKRESTSLIFCAYDN